MSSLKSQNVSTSFQTKQWGGTRIDTYPCVSDNYVLNNLVPACCASEIKKIFQSDRNTIELHRCPCRAWSFIAFIYDTWSVLCRNHQQFQSAPYDDISSLMVIFSKLSILQENFKTLASQNETRAT